MSADLSDNENKDPESANAKSPNKQKSLDSKKLRKFTNPQRSLRFLKFLIILNGWVFSFLN